MLTNRICILPPFSVRAPTYHRDIIFLLNSRRHEDEIARDWYFQRKVQFEMLDRQGSKRMEDAMKGGNPERECNDEGVQFSGNIAYNFVEIVSF